MTRARVITMVTELRSWVVGGGLLVGLGVGFFFLPDALAFVGSLLAGLGLGLVLAPLVKK